MCISYRSLILLCISSASWALVNCSRPPGIKGTVIAGSEENRSSSLVPKSFWPGPSNSDRSTRSAAIRAVATGIGEILTTPKFHLVLDGSHVQPVHPSIGTPLTSYETPATAPRIGFRVHWAVRANSGPRDWSAGATGQTERRSTNRSVHTRPRRLTEAIRGDVPPMLANQSSHTRDHHRHQTVFVPGLDEDRLSFGTIGPISNRRRRPLAVPRCHQVGDTRTENKDLFRHAPDGSTRRIVQSAQPRPWLVSSVDPGTGRFTTRLGDNGLMRNFPDTLNGPRWSPTPVRHARIAAR